MDPVTTSARITYMYASEAFWLKSDFLISSTDTAFATHICWFVDRDKREDRQTKEQTDHVTVSFFFLCVCETANDNVWYWNQALFLKKNKKNFTNSNNNMIWNYLLFKKHIKSKIRLQWRSNGRSTGLYGI